MENITAGVSPENRDSVVARAPQLNPNLDWSAPRDRQKIEFVNFNGSRNNATRNKSFASENEGSDRSENKKIKRKEMNTSKWTSRFSSFIYVSYIWYDYDFGKVGDPS
jgi:hypothetical protein